MNNSIERTLFWFSDGDIKLNGLNEQYFSIALLVNRLLNESYLGKKLKFINIYFRTERTFELYPNAPKNYTHYYDGNLNYDDVFDLVSFQKLNKEKQIEFIWNRTFEILKEVAIKIKNHSLLEASYIAFRKGIKLNFNPDYRLIEKDIKLYGKKLKASLWINFKEDGMYSKFTLESEGNIVFEKDIDKTKNGVEYFLEIYKRIELKDEHIIIKGHKDISYLPLKIKIPREDIYLNN